MLEKTEWAIKNGQSIKNWQHWVHKTQDEEKKNPNKMSNHKMLDITIRKHIQKHKNT